MTHVCYTRVPPLNLSFISFRHLVFCVAVAFVRLQFYCLLLSLSRFTYSIDIYYACIIFRSVNRFGTFSSAIVSCITCRALFHSYIFAWFERVWHTLRIRHYPIMWLLIYLSYNYIRLCVNNRWDIHLLQEGFKWKNATYWKFEQLNPSEQATCHCIHAASENSKS